MMPSLAIFLPVRRFADVWTSPLIEEVNTLDLSAFSASLALLKAFDFFVFLQDFYVPEHERIAVTTMPPATHPTPAALDTPRSPAPQIPGTREYCTLRLMVRLTRGVVRHLVKKSKARLAPSDLTTVEKANYYMKEALKDEYVHHSL
jgi:hypothetical protein